VRYSAETPFVLFFSATFFSLSGAKKCHMPPEHYMLLQLTLIYNEIIKKEKITGMIAISYGGLSVYEQVKILANSKLNMPDYYREACQNIDTLKKEIEKYPDSLDEIMGYTYGWWI
jgi:hypothetical protein